MRIILNIKFAETYAVELLNGLAAHNALALLALAKQGTLLPLLYDSGVVYEREEEELWSDYPSLLDQGHEDCDALAAARAGELIAWGWEALRPGEGGYREARRSRPESIDAEVILRTRRQPGERGGLYHCIVEYRVGDTIYRDDPSARLGMLGRRPPVNPWGDRPVRLAA
jgi:hypothetical protein